MSFLLLFLYLAHCSIYLFLLKDDSFILSPGDFSYGYTYGLFEKIIIVKLPCFGLKVTGALVSLGFRLYYFRPDQILPLLAQILMLAFSFASDYLEKKEDVKTYRSFSQYKANLKKFKTLLTNELPTSVLILSADLKQILFQNEALVKNINLQMPSVKEHDFVFDWLRCSSIDPKGLNDESPKDSPSSPKEWTKNWSVLHFLRIISNNQNNSTFKQKKHQFNAEFHPDSSTSRKAYEIEISSLLWDEKEALVLTFNDITDYFQNLTMKVADANKNKMLAMISHELKTPLNGILGVVNILKKELTQPHLLQYLSICKSSSELLLNLVNSILDLQKIRDNKFILKLSKDNLHHLLMEIFDLFKFQFDQKSLDLQLIISPKVPEFIVTDQNRLRQILINLIGNSLKFTYKGGVIITASYLEGYINIKVADTGIGISQEDQKKLFKMYGRLDQADPSVNTQGTGFGLEVSNQLAKLLVGDQNQKGIEVESQQGKGTTFSFKIKDCSQSLQEGSLENFSETDLKYHEPRVFDENVENISARMSAYSLFSSCVLSEKPLGPETGRSVCLNPKRNSIIENNGPRALELDSFDLLLNNEAFSPKHFYNQKSHLLTPFNKERSPASRRHSRKLEKSGSRKSSYHRSFSKMAIQASPKSASKILLVDDNPFNLLVAKTMLEGLKYSVVTALNGKLAIEEVVKEANFCLILMDIQMPVIDGYEATRELRRMMERKEIPEIPIVALSANDSEEDKIRSKEAGMCTHLSKPLHEESLKIVLDEILGKNPLENDENTMNLHPQEFELRY